MKGEKVQTKAEMYRRQLGGTNAALNRCRQRSRELEELCRDWCLLCARAAAAGPGDKRDIVEKIDEFTGRMEDLGLLDQEVR